ncbi:MAG: hypothetical protein JOY82_04770 [Streptosporangiaceae bacterium]|nr:hypothetical protein [Streptosporangiaceae bacterium]MBV9853826.1 hypothetical protein [Streptosporangiaceae bacterium]
MTPVGLITATRIACFTGAGAASVALGLMAVPLALTVSTSILAGLIGLHLLLDRGWIRLVGTTASAAQSATEGATETEPGVDRDWGAAFKDGANLVITVEGVVLGLVFAFIAKGTASSTLVNVGAASLAAGVVLGILLYSLAAGGIPGAWGAAIASLMLNISLYALAYGLICIVGALITAPASSLSGI